MAGRYAARGGPAWFQGRYAANELTYHVCRKSQLLQLGTLAYTPGVTVRSFHALYRVCYLVVQRGCCREVPVEHAFSLVQHLSRL